MSERVGMQPKAIAATRLVYAALVYVALGYVALGLRFHASAVAQNPPMQLQPSAGPALTAEPSPAAAATTTAPASTNSETVEGLIQQVTQRLERLASDTELPAADREQLTKTYQATLRDLQAILKVRQRKAEFTQATADAPSALEVAKARKQELDSLPPPQSQEFQTLSLEELDQLRIALEAELATATAQRTALSDSLAQREKRRKELPQLISDSKAKAEQWNAQAQPAPGTTVTVSQEAANASRDIARVLVSEQQQSYEAEQRLYEAEAKLQPLRLEIAQATEKRLQDRLRLLNEQLEQLRANRIQSTYNAARRLAAAASPHLTTFGERMLERIRLWMELSSQRAELQEELSSAQELLTQWSNRRKQMLARVEPEPGPNGVSNVIAGFNSWVGLMLRKQRGELPDPQLMAAKIRGYQSQLQTAESLLFDIEDAHQEIRLRVDGQANATAVGESTAGERVSADARLLDFATEQLYAMTEDVNAYQDDLYALADIRENTIQLVKDYREFIDKHVLWIRSAEPLNNANWETSWEALNWLGGWENWQALGELLGQDARQRPVWYALLALLCIVIFTNHSRLRRGLNELGSKAEKNSCTGYRITARALLFTLVLSVPLPLLLQFFYWRITVSMSRVETSSLASFPAAIASGLWLTSVVFIPMELARQLCRPGGLGIKHFGWNESAALRLRANLRWFIDYCIPFSLLIGIFHNHEVERWESAIGRIAFILLLPMLSVFFARVLAPRTGVISVWLQRNQGGWLDRLSWLWYPAHLVYPLALTAVSFVGYHYTAQRIAAHMVSTLWLVVVLTLLYHMLMRWLVLGRRRLMLAQARQRLEEAARREAAGEAPQAIDEPRLNLVAINEQTKRLVTSLIVALGLVLLYLIWSDVLPAVAMLDGIRLWPLYGTVTPETFTITLASVLLVIPLVVLIVIAGRNVPGLLEIALLQNLPLSSAARYAITTLSRYTIFALGIIVVSSMIGLQWNSIQWLVAALGVGLGFGLQEIFANFVSGIILLFEQPIRVGDIISIDGTTGSVSKIRMRATTIINWDRQELIVPNKDMITGKLLNWTLSDSTNRIVINVGIAYGSDTERACELIMQACQEHPNVLREPAPSVTFESFGDNSLKLVLRAFLDSLDNRLPTIHQLHQRIYKELTRAQIEVALPQRDIHIRSVPEGWKRWLDKAN